MVPVPLLKNCQEPTFLKKFSYLHVSYAKQMTHLSTSKTIWTVNSEIESRNNRNFSRLALDSQVQRLSQASCAQMKLKIAVAPSVFACIFSWLISSHMPAKQRRPVSLILFIVLTRKLLLLVAYRIIDCALSTTILWSSLRNEDFYRKTEYFSITAVFFLIKKLLWLEESPFLNFID